MITITLAQLERAIPFLPQLDDLEIKNGKDAYNAGKLSRLLKIEAEMLAERRGIICKQHGGVLNAQGGYAVPNENLEAVTKELNEMSKAEVELTVTSIPFESLHKAGARVGIFSNFGFAINEPLAEEPAA